MSQDLLLARTRDMAFCPILRFNKTYPVKSEMMYVVLEASTLFLLFKYLWLLKKILIPKFLNFPWSATSKLLNRVGGQTSVHKTSLLAHNLHKREGFFL